jgi:hypothetical protein
LQNSMRHLVRQRHGVPQVIFQVFVAEIWEKRLNIINVEIWENNAEI